MYVIYDTKKQLKNLKQKTRNKKLVTLKGTTMSTINSQMWAEFIADVSKPYFNRENEISAILIGLLSELNVVIIGPPGVAKSAIADRLLARLPAPTFSAQLNPYSDPEQILGPLSLKKLREEDARERMTEGYLPEARYANLDEIFKATGSTLVSLLQILNERKIAEEGKIIQCPLKCVIGASNERPDEQSNALADRFALWIPFEYTENRQAMLLHVLDYVDTDPINPKTNRPMPKKVLTMSDVLQFRDQTNAVLQKNKEEIVKKVLAFDTKVQKFAGRLAQESKLSDRSLIQCMRLIAASCVLRGDTVVDKNDAWILRYMSRTEECVPFYVQASDDLMALGQSLAIITKMLDSKTVADELTTHQKLAIQTSLPSLPIAWQVSLSKRLELSSTLEKSNNSSVSNLFEKLAQTAKK